MHRRSHRIITLALLTLLMISPGQALAHGEGLQQTVDGYTVTLVLPEKGFATGQNALTVNLWDWQGNAPEATVSTALLAFTPAADGHGDSHGEAAPTGDHSAAADDHRTADGPSAVADDHGAAEAEHDHSDASATEGRGIVPAPVALAPGAELGEYQGALTFGEPGTWTVSVVFAIDGQERGVIFDVEVAQSRPRGLVLGGFALVNVLAMASAAVLKYRTPSKPARKPTRPATTSAATSPEEQP